MKIKGLKYGDSGGTALTKLRLMDPLALVKLLRLIMVAARLVLQPG